jgi:glucosamine-6-phosphate deaminase
MDIRVFETKEDIGSVGGDLVEQKLQSALRERGRVTLVLATGTSQFDLLDALTARPMEWASVEVFHLDEYIGLDASHPASFRRYLHERFVDKVGRLAAFHGIDGSADDPQAECKRLSKLISQVAVDVACVGIGENGHLAFNDPPADFQTTDPFLIVELDPTCRKQQLDEGWFETLDEVPTHAISMSCREILQAGRIVCLAPEARKAQPVGQAVNGPIDPLCPASILQKHAECYMLLDDASAALLPEPMQRTRSLTN